MQIALLTDRINYLTDHLKTHKHDFSGRRGLLKLVGQRRSLLKYLNGKNVNKYREILDSDYFEWCYEKYLREEESDYEESYEEEEDGYFNNRFSVDMWNMYYCNEERVMDFIYETYLDEEHLPYPKN